MDIHLTFSVPQNIDGKPYCELTVTAERLTIGGGVLRAVDAGTVVAEAPLTELAVIDLLTRRSVSALRERHPNAYSPWSADDDQALAALAREGAALEALMERFGRGKNSILARLFKLGVLAR